MKRAIVLALIGLMAFGVLAFAAKETMPQNCGIPGYWSLDELSEYTFAGTGYQLADKVGWCYASGEWCLKVTTNKRLQMSIDFSKAQFSGTATYIGAVTLPTSFNGTATGDRVYMQGGWVEPASIPWTGWYDASVIATVLGGAGPIYIDPAYAQGCVKAAVYRDGLNDPAATYTSTITVKVWVP